MGDMADWIIDNGIEEAIFDYGGLISCKYCSEDYLHWENFNGKWRLANEECVIHECKYVQYKPVYALVHCNTSRIIGWNVVNVEGVVIDSGPFLQPLKDKYGTKNR